MRFAAVLLVLTAFTAPVAAQEVTAATFNGYRQIPCKVYVNPKSDPTGDIVDILPEIRSSVRSYVIEHGAFDSYPSECNVNAYVEAECRLTPKASIGSAVDSLYAKMRTGKPLPRPHVCGA